MVLHCPFKRAKGVREIGVIERYAAVISTLDGSLEPREGDDFLSWLRSQGFDTDVATAAAAEEEAQEAAERSPDGDDGVDVDRNNDGRGEASDAANRRAEVEAFLSAAAARLNALVVDKEESLFGDRGEKSAVEEDGNDADEKGAAAKGEAAILPNMSDEDLYQVHGGREGTGGDGRLSWIVLGVRFLHLAYEVVWLRRSIGGGRGQWFSGEKACRLLVL